jgi:hypothetical protein
VSEAKRLKMRQDENRLLKRAEERGMLRVVLVASANSTNVVVRRATTTASGVVLVHTICLLNLPCRRRPLLWQACSGIFGLPGDKTMSR